MKAVASALAGLAGLAVVLGTVGALSYGTKADATPRDDWRPVCAAHQGWASIDVRISDDTTPSDRKSSDARWVLFGLDMSPSNRELATAQLDEIATAMKTLPPEVGTSALLISDRSDLSTTPDLALQSPAFAPEVVVSGLDCWPDCTTDSLAAQSCFAQLTTAVDARVDARRDEARKVLTDVAARRAHTVDAWRSEVVDWHPKKPGTSLVRFFHKVADLPPVRTDPAGVTVFVLSDLEEARTQDRRALDRLTKTYSSTGECPTDSPLPNLEGLRVILVQSVQSRVNATSWADRWTIALRCSGAQTEVRRYSRAVPLGRLVEDAS